MSLRSDPEAMREYKRKWLAGRRAAFFADKCCKVCGSTQELRLDHIDPKQKVDHKIWSWREERRDAELAKCQVLCHEHHTIKTTENDIKRTQHGKLHMYTLYGCRCELCVAAKQRENGRNRRRTPSGLVRHVWTETDDAVLLANRNKIAAQLIGVTVGSVQSRRSQLRVKIGVLCPP